MPCRTPACFCLLRFCCMLNESEFAISAALHKMPCTLHDYCTCCCESKTLRMVGDLAVSRCFSTTDCCMCATPPSTRSLSPLVSTHVCSRMQMAVEDPSPELGELDREFVVDLPGACTTHALTRHARTRARTHTHAHTHACARTHARTRTHVHHPHTAHATHTTNFSPQTRTHLYTHPHVHARRWL